MARHVSPLCQERSRQPLFAAMFAQASAPRGMAAAPSLQRRSMRQRSNAAAARPSSHGCSRQRARARVCNPVAAAASGSGISSHAAIKAIKAWLAVPNLLAAASAAVTAWWSRLLWRCSWGQRLASL